MLTEPRAWFSLCTHTQGKNRGWEPNIKKKKSIFLFLATIHSDIMCVMSLRSPKMMYEIHIIVSHSHGLFVIGNLFGSRYSSLCWVSISVPGMNRYTCSLMSVDLPPCWIVAAEIWSCSKHIKFTHYPQRNRLVFFLGKFSYNKGHSRTMMNTGGFKQPTKDIQSNIW